MSGGAKAALLGAAALALLVVVAATAIYVLSWDFGDDAFEAPPPPTAADLARIRDRSGFPVYWLGPEYGRHELEHADPEPDDGSVLLSYGGPYCDSFDEVCNYEIEVGTSPNRAVVTEDPGSGRRDPICWRRIGPAVVLGCDGRGEVTKYLFTGPVLVEVYANSDSPFRVAAALRPMRGGAGLAAPRPLSCRETRQMSARLRRTLPRELRGCGDR